MMDLKQARRVVREWRGRPLPFAGADEALAHMIADVVALEREMCARTAAVAARGLEGEARSAAHRIAEAIRARVKESSPPSAEALGTEASGTEALLRTYLRINPNTYVCGLCISRELKVPIRTAQQAVERLTPLPGYEQGYFWCSYCGESRHVLRFVGPKVELGGGLPPPSQQQGCGGKAAARTSGIAWVETALERWLRQ